MRRILNIFTLIIYTLNSCLAPLSVFANDQLTIEEQVSELHEKAPFKESVRHLSKNENGAYILHKVKLDNNFMHITLYDGEKEIGTLDSAHGCLILTGKARHSFVLSGPLDFETFEVKIGGNFTAEDKISANYFIKISAPEINLNKGAKTESDQGYISLNQGNANLGGSISAKSLVFNNVDNITFNKTAKLDVGQIMTSSKVKLVRNLGEIKVNLCHLEAEKISNNADMDLGTANLKVGSLLNRKNLVVEMLVMQGDEFKNLKNFTAKSAQLDVTTTMNKDVMTITDDIHFATGSSFVNSGTFTVYGYAQGKLTQLIDDGESVIHGIAIFEADYGRLRGDFKARYGSIRFTEELHIKGTISSSEHITLHSDGNVIIDQDGVVEMQDYAWSDVDYGQHTLDLINAMRRGVFISAKGDIIRDGDVTSTNGSLTFTPDGNYIERNGISRHGIFANNNMQVSAAEAELSDETAAAQRLYVKATLLNLVGEKTSREFIIDVDNLDIAKDAELGALQGITKNTTISSHLKLSKHLNLKVLNKFRTTWSSKIVADIIAIDGKHSELKGTLKAQKGVQIKGETCDNLGIIDGGTKVDVDVTNGFFNALDAMVYGQQIDVNADNYVFNFLAGMEGDVVNINTTWNLNALGWINGRKSLNVNATALNASLGVYQSNSYASNSALNISPFGLVAFSVPSDRKGFWDSDKSWTDQYLFRTGLSIGLQYASGYTEFGIRAVQFGLSAKDFIVARMPDDTQKEEEKEDDGEQYRGSRIAKQAAKALSLGLSTYQLYKSAHGLSDKWLALGGTEVPEKVLLWDQAKASAATLLSGCATERSLFSYKGDYHAYLMPSVNVKTYRGYDLGEHFTLSSSLYAVDHFEVGGTKHAVNSFSVESGGSLKVRDDFGNYGGGSTQLHAAQTDISEGFGGTGKKLSLKGVELSSVDLHELRTQTGKFEGLDIADEVAVEGHFDAEFDQSSESASKSFKIKADTITVGEHVILTASGTQKLEATEADITMGAGSKLKSGVLTDIKAKRKVIGLHNKDVVANGRAGTDVSYEGVMIIGGTGVDYVFNDPETGETSIRKLGLRIVADDTVDCTGVQFAADADISIDGKNGVVNASDKEVHITNMHTSKKKLSTTYHDNYRTDFFTGAFETPGKVVILSENGGFRQEAGVICAKEGMYIITKKKIDLTSITGQHGVISRKHGRSALPNSSKSNISGLSLSSLLMSQGNSRIFVHSKEGQVDARGLRVHNPEGSLTLKAYKVILDRDVLENSASSKGVRMQTHVTGLQRPTSLSAMSQAKDSAAALMAGDLTGVANMPGAPSIDVTVGYHSSQTNYQTLGDGGIDVRHVDIDTGENGELVLGNGYGIAAKTGSIKSKKVTQTGAALHSKTKKKSAVISPVDVRVAKSVTKKTTHVPSVVNIGELHAEIEELEQTGGVINTNKMTGHIDSVKSTSQQDTSSTKSASASVDIFGKTSATAGFSRSRQTNTISGINAGSESTATIGQADLRGAEIKGVTPDKVTKTSLTKDHKARGLRVAMTGHFEQGSDGNVTHALDSVALGGTKDGHHADMVLDVRDAKRDTAPDGALSYARDDKNGKRTFAYTTPIVLPSMNAAPQDKAPQNNASQNDIPQDTSEKVTRMCANRQLPIANYAPEMKEPPLPVITDAEKAALLPLPTAQGPMPAETATHPPASTQKTDTTKTQDENMRSQANAALFVADQMADLSGVKALKRIVKGADLAVHIKDELDDGKDVLPAMGRGALKTTVDAGVSGSVVLAATAAGGPAAGIAAGAGMVAAEFLPDYSAEEMQKKEKEADEAFKNGDIEKIHAAIRNYKQAEAVAGTKAFLTAPAKFAEQTSDFLLSTPEQKPEVYPPEIQAMIDSGEWAKMKLIEKTVMKARYSD